MVEDRIETDQFYPSKDMEYEISLLDCKCTTNGGVIYRINKDRSGIYLEAFELGGLRLRVKDLMSYKPWRFGCYNKGSGQLGVYKLEDQKGKLYFAVIKDYIAAEDDWRIALVNIRESEWELRSWLQMDPHCGFALADYAFGRIDSDNGKK